MKQSQPVKKKVNCRCRVMIALALVLSLIITAISPLNVQASMGSQESGNQSSTGKENIYEATIYQIFTKWTSSDAYVVTVDEYYYSSATQPLLLVSERGYGLGSYVKDYDSSLSYLYVLNDLGEAVAPTVIHKSNYTITMSSGVVVRTDYDTETTLPTLNYYTIGSRSQSYNFYIEGDYETLAYTPFSYSQIDGAASTRVTSAEVAKYYLKTGDNVHVNWGAFSFDLDSRSVFNFFGNYTKAADYSISDSVLENGTFTHNGVGYSSDDVWRGGIRVAFKYLRTDTASTYQTFYYNYLLPLEGGQYDFNFADVQTIKLANYTFSLQSVTLTPVIQMEWYSPLSGSIPLTYTVEELEAAGCLEDGGNPVTLLSLDKSSSTNGKPSGDPSIDEMGDEQNKGGSDSMESPGDLEWDSSEHGFWENVLYFLENLANNIASIGTNILALVPTLTESLRDAFSDLMEYFFVPDEEAYQAKVDTLNERFGFIDQIKSAYSYINHFFEISSGTKVPRYSIPIKCEAWGIDDKVVIDFSWYAPFKPLFDNLIAGFCWLTFIFNVWRKLPDIIGGAGAGVSAITNTIQRSSIESRTSDEAITESSSLLPGSIGDFL